MPDVRGSVDLVEFSFVSKIQPGLPTSALLRIARQSWSFNLRMGLTGELRLIGDTFAEEIEGPCDVVQPLAARILGDDRHGSIRISAFRRLSGRRHAGWSTSGFGLALPVSEVATGEAGGLRGVPVLGRPQPPRRAAAPGGFATGPAWRS